MNNKYKVEKLIFIKNKFEGIFKNKIQGSLWDCYLQNENWTQNYSHSVSSTFAGIRNLSGPLIALHTNDIFAWIAPDQLLGGNATAPDHHVLGDAPLAGHWIAAPEGRVQPGHGACRHWWRLRQRRRQRRCGWGGHGRSRWHLIALILRGSGFRFVWRDFKMVEL